MTTLSKDQVTALLGRVLSPTEETNFNLYLDISKLRLNDLLCFDVAGLEDLPNDLALVWARFFDGVTKENSTEAGNVASKRVEDFQITFRETSSTVMRDIVAANQATLAKYSQCVSHIRHGETIYDRGCHDCI